MRKHGEHLKVYIHTFGCQMNVRDSEMAMGRLLQAGYKRAQSPEEADVVLFNGCSVRKHAEERAISNLGKLLKTRTKMPMVYGLIGCTAQALKDDLFKRLPGLNLVCGTGELQRLPELIEKARQAPVIACDNLDNEYRGEQPFAPVYRENKKPAYVLIARGCNNYCSYCIVPYVRGPERSRAPEDILAEIKFLAQRGYKDIMLLGQNVNSYRANGSGFTRLLGAANAIEGIEKISFMTSHPKDAGLELFKAIRDLDKVEKELHLPLQSGSDRILKLMNRGYSADHYKKQIEQLRKLVPCCKLTTDLMVGFPGETEKDFQDTYGIMKEIQFNAAYIFKYSPRPPAKSALMTDDVAPQEKERRHQILLDYQIKISAVKKTSLAITLFLLTVLPGKLVLAQSSSAFKNAETLILKESYAQAAAECQRILAHNHQEATRSYGYYLLGTCQLKEQKYAQARENFQSILDQYPRGKFADDAELGVADSYFLAGELEPARKKYEEFLWRFPASELTNLARQGLEKSRADKPDDSGGFSVQVGCFSSKGNADKLRQGLINRGYDTYVVKLPGDSLFRVRVGKFAAKAQAEAAEHKLQVEGFSTKLCP